MSILLAMGLMLFNPIFSISDDITVNWYEYEPVHFDQQVNYPPADFEEVEEEPVSEEEPVQVVYEKEEDRENEPESLSFEATFYVAFCDTGCIGITRTGYDVSETIYSPGGRRIIAVDPTVIPLHSIVEITLEDGTTFEAKALDTGGAIKGSIVDILVADTSTAWNKGRQQIELTIIREGK